MTMSGDLQMGMKCIKYMLLTINMMFVLTATLIISVGTIIYAIYYDYQDFIHVRYFSPASLLIAIGVIMLFVSFFGCIGAAKESTAMVNVFAVLLSLVFLLEIAATISAYSLQNGLREVVHNNLKYNLETYNTSISSKEAMDFLQKNLQCCGIDDPMDWKDIIATNQTADNATLPMSCYKTGVIEFGELRYYTTGCMNNLVRLIAQSSVLLGTGAMTIAFIQFIGIIFSVMLAKTIRQAKSDRERRKWEIREQIANAYTQMEPNQIKKIDHQAPIIYVPTIGSSDS